MQTVALMLVLQIGQADKIWQDYKVAVRQRIEQNSIQSLVVEEQWDEIRVIIRYQEGKICEARSYFYRDRIPVTYVRNQEYTFSDIEKLSLTTDTNGNFILYYFDNASTATIRTKDGFVQADQPGVWRFHITKKLSTQYEVTDLDKLDMLRGIIQKNIEWPETKGDFAEPFVDLSKE